mgnify:CR=1 FL=1
MLDKSVSASAGSVDEDFVGSASINTVVFGIIELLTVGAVTSVHWWVQETVSGTGNTLFVIEVSHESIKASTSSQNEDFILSTS